MKYANKTMASMIGAFLFGIAAFGAATFDQIKFNTETYSEADPLGIQAIKTVQNDVVTVSNKAVAAETKATQAENKAIAVQNTLSTYTNEMSSAVTKTDKAVVVGSVKGTPNDIGMTASTNAIIFGVNRDIDELETAPGEILFSANKIRLDADTSSIWFGSSTLAQILSSIESAAGAGEMNTISTISTNGVALVPDGNKRVDIVIPAPGEVNTITGITLNGNDLTPSDKVVAIAAATKVTTTTNGIEVTYEQNNGTITLPEFVLMKDLKEGIGFDTLNVTNLTVDGVKVSLEGHKHAASDITNFNDSVTALIPAVGDANVIESVKVNGTALTINNKTVNVEVPVINGLYSIPGAEIAATNAIQAINNATSIAEIKAAFTNFLNSFKTPVTP